MRCGVSEQRPPKPKARGKTTQSAGKHCHTALWRLQCEVRWRVVEQFWGPRLRKTKAPKKKGIRSSWAQGLRAAVSKQCLPGCGSAELPLGKTALNTKFRGKIVKKLKILSFYVSFLIFPCWFHFSVRSFRAEAPKAKGEKKKTTLSVALPSHRSKKPH